jgi:hypothetical protein
MGTNPQDGGVLGVMTSVSGRRLVGVAVGVMLLGRLAAEQGPTWLALGVAFREADPGTVVNGDAEKKLPLYDELSPTVYQFRDRDALHKGVLGFVPHPRWFAAVGPAKGSGDLPLTDQGASLSFGIAPLTDGDLRFDLTVEAKERDVYFQIEHRRNDMTPFLFAFTADGEAVDAKPASGGVNGGLSLMDLLAKKGERTGFSLTVDPGNVLALVGERKVTELSVVAAFCERRQEFGTHGTGGPIGGKNKTTVIDGVGEVPVITEDSAPPIAGDEGEVIPFEHRPILIRSKPVRLVLSEGKWVVKAE